MPDTGDSVTGRVKWFDATKGYGFVVPDDGGGDVLLHANVLRTHGYAGVSDGAAITLRVQATDKGRQACEIEYLDPDAILSAEAPRPPRPTELVAAATVTSPLQPASVKWFDKVKGFGFVNVFGDGRDVFVHMEVLRRSSLNDLAPGEAVAVRIIEGPRGRMASEVAPWDRAVEERTDPEA